MKLYTPNQIQNILDYQYIDDEEIFETSSRVDQLLIINDYLDEVIINCIDTIEENQPSILDWNQMLKEATKAKLSLKSPKVAELFLKQFHPKDKIMKQYEENPRILREIRHLLTLQADEIEELESCIGALERARDFMCFESEIEIYSIIFILKKHRDSIK